MEVVSTLDGNAPTDPEVFIRLGGREVLQSFCAGKLLELGCDPATLTFAGPQLVNGKWTIRGKGDKR